MEIKDSAGKEVNESHIAFKLIAYRFYEIWESYRDINSDEFRRDQEVYAEECLSDFLDWKEVKWYELDSDMSKLSKLCPDFTFIIEGQGEDRGIGGLSGGKTACKMQVMQNLFRLRVLLVTDSHTNFWLVNLLYTPSFQ